MDEEGSQRLLLEDRDEQVAPGIPEPALFHVDVDDGIDGNDDQPKVLQAGAPKMLGKLEMEMPDSLAVIPKVDQTVVMTFQQLASVTNQIWPYSASPMSEFKIDGKQFDPECVNVTTKLGTTGGVGRSPAPRSSPHPFHIHTNPFLLNQLQRRAPGARGRPCAAAGLDGHHAPAQGDPGLLRGPEPVPGERFRARSVRRTSARSRRPRWSSATATTSSPATTCCTATSSATRTAA